MLTGTGTFVWADNVGGGETFTVNANNAFYVRASGGTNIYSNSVGNGVQLLPGASSWTSISNRNMKENFQDVDEVEILEKLMNIPIQSWNYKSQDASIRHIGPMAQDFNPAFGFNEDPLGISTLDFDGVALAAIKGLCKRYDQRISDLEELVQQLIRQQQK